MPSLEELLKKKPITTNKFRKPVNIATEDRPYSSADSESLQPIFDQTSSQPKSLFNPGVEEIENSRVTFLNSQNVLRNHENIVKETGNKVDINHTQTQHKLNTNYTHFFTYWCSKKDAFIPL